MVSFSCENCGDVLTKGKLDKHRGQCRGASFTCLDCMVHFQGTSYKSHTSCMSEAQKYEGSFYKEKDRKGKSQQLPQSGTMIPRKAYVEDEQDTEMADGAVAVIDVPPHAPSPPPPKDDVLPPGTNVYDFLVKEDGPSKSSSTALARAGQTHQLHTQPSTISNDSHFQQHGFSYGDAPIHPSRERYQSSSSLVPQGDSQSFDSRSHSQQYLTPGPNRRDRDDYSRDDGKSDKKRKRQHVEELDIARAHRNEIDSSGGKPQLHSGLTGGLSRLLARPVDELDRQVALANSPLSPMKRSRKDKADYRRRREGEDRNGDSRRDQRTRRRRDSSSSEDDRRAAHGKVRAIEYHKSSRPSSNPTSAGGQLVQYKNPAELFLSFINKGPESERGVSINKALKRYHRERGQESERDRETNDKELWKELRLRRNERGEIVLFF